MFSGRKKIKFLSAIHYGTFPFFSPFPALAHLKGHVFPSPILLDAHLCQLAVPLLSIRDCRKKCSLKKYKCMKPFHHLEEKWHNGRTCKNSFLLKGISQPFLIQWMDLKSTDLEEEKRSCEKNWSTKWKDKILSVSALSTWSRWLLNLEKLYILKTGSQVPIDF